jgi:hypothetical protein
VAERRDLMVATYSLDWATGESATDMVCTGIACIAAGAAGFFWQPVAANPNKTKPVPIKRFNALFLT